MKLASFQAVISPEVGTAVAGYGPNDVSVMKYDDLTLQGVCLDDGAKKVLLISYDLVGMALELVQTIREGCAKLIGETEAEVMLSCTHTHGGPHTRPLNSRGMDEVACKIVVDQTLKAVGALKPEDFIEGDMYFYSASADANINRRYCGPENVCRFLPHHRQLEGIADGFRDTEVGLLAFFDKERQPRELIVNYAAHPLASHAPGYGGHAITSDYPGLLRKYLNEATGAHVTFVSGAAGDQFPIDSEIGFMNLDTIAKPVAREVVRGLSNVPRNPELFKLSDAKLQTKRVMVEVGVRDRPEHPRQMLRYRNVKTATLEMQLLAIGDVCLVGVPGELLAETGMEIKWNTPFRKAFIVYNSTGYEDYIGHANALVSGGYEAECQQFEGRTGLKLVTAAVDGMYEMKPGAE